MQTFLPFPDFAATAAVLDRARLGKQRVETIQVVRAITVPDYGWRHHPAALMWRGRLEALGAYGLAIVDEWLRRGHADTCGATIAADVGLAGVPLIRSQAELEVAGELPSWLGDEDVHRSHQSALVRKDPEHYAHLFPGVPDDLPYVWPPGDA
ncbi:MSMEG_6728 family protein [Aeromicrobium wangtongii]|uniref:MSMEG_6728 family protein n=1 Tax=Aeromicrobium wangtongii TaxID=2969247 RepID=A0ABY5MBF6_9ACTN|nr:MSMEG_6728 family protein [Aeromicrobium wangtongii]MCD9199718.1 MSMEG_6728 family protein [Aeromicrobium wangtongii]UUP14067.1 MSMEG_6728 family protein [Aeromicrobium wangtongii]